MLTRCSKSLLLRKNYSYRLLTFKIRPVKIICYDTDYIIFTDMRGKLKVIDAEFLPFWGKDIFAEIICELYKDSHLLINNSRSREYYEELKSNLDEKDLIKFCNMNKKRWKPLEAKDFSLSGFT